MKTPRQFMTLFILAATVFILSQCSTNDPTPVSKPADVYMAGRYNNGAAYLPAYWKNGTLVTLAETGGEAQAIAVVGSNVYVIGQMNNTDKKQLWTNGVASDFADAGPNTGNYVYSMKVFGSDWFAIGMSTSVNGDDATYWKNGVAHVVATGEDSRAYDIEVVGADVYVAGFQRNVSGLTVAKVWKNNVGTELTDGTNYGDADGIAVVNNDVYVSGNDNGTLKIWKNGAVTTTGDASTNTAQSSITVHNNDVYVVGYSSAGVSEAKYWKNGVAFTLPKPATAANTYGYTIAVSGNDIYFLGEILMDNAYRTIVWKNFELLAPHDGTSAASGYGIFVGK